MGWTGPLTVTVRVLENVTSDALPDTTQMVEVNWGPSFWRRAYWHKHQLAIGSEIDRRLIRQYNDR